MDTSNNDKLPEGQNQAGAQPIFESVPVDEASAQKSEEAPESMGEEYPEVPLEETAPAYEENRMRYFFVGLGVLFFIIIFVVLIFFLRRFTGKNDKKITLVYWGLWEEAQTMSPLFEKYKRRNPAVTIEYTKMDPASYREKLIERSKNGKGPDIFRFHNTWLPMLKEIIAPLPLSIMANATFEKTFYPVIQKDLKIGDFYYGLPLEIDGLVLVYNDDLFKRAGLATPPKTWEDVANYATQLTVKTQEGSIITSGIALGTATNIEHFSDIFGWMFVQNGGSLARLTAPEARDALEAYRKFAESPRNVWDSDMPNSVTAFIQGKVAMIIVPSWELSFIKLTNPDLQIKVAELPIIPGGSKVSLANYWVEGVSKLSRNQLEGWKFLKFLVEKENLTTFYEEASKTRLFGEPYSRVDMAPLLLQHEYIGPVIQQAPYMKSLTVVSRTFDNGANDEIIKYLEDAISATVNGVSYEEALNTAQKGVEQVFQKYTIE
ncbi:MAG TPA: sugar ABC transporter substrate-binding protein [Patescibacteria group bacterium]|nr:sugar ABC transporter substrate-binding protein [Patescibacteria group bacterium]